MIKLTTAAEQQNQRTLEDHTQTVDSTSAAWNCAAWNCAVAPSTIDSVERMSSAVVVKEEDKLDFPAETVDGGRVMLVVVP